MFPLIHGFRKTKKGLKPKPVPESPRPGAADCSGKIIKSALAVLGSWVYLAGVPEILRGKFVRVLQGHSIRYLKFLAQETRLGSQLRRCSLDHSKQI
jgi:hypothetical protein